MSKTANPFDTKINEHVGGKLRRRRKALGLTQRQVSTHVGVVYQQIDKYENGSSGTSAAMLWKLAEVLEVPVTYFYEGLADASAPAN